MRIEAASGGSYQIERNGAGLAGVSLTNRLRPFAYGVQQSRIRGTEVGPGGGAGVVIRRRRRRSTPEVARVVERLTDEGRAEDLVVAFNHTAVGLKGEHGLSEHGHERRIGDTGDERQDSENAQSR